MRLTRLVLPAAFLAFLGSAAARADDGKAADKKSTVVEADKGPQIEWARSWDEAVQEASERNMPIMLHSHARTCGPCKVIQKTVLADPAYVKWANEKTIHLLSYDLQKDLDGGPAEAIAQGERGGKKVEVLAHYPGFTLDEVQALLNEIGAKLKFPTTTPWEGVLSPDGQKILWDNPEKKRTAKTFEDAYEAEQGKLGKTLGKSEWKRACTLLDASVKADGDSKWKEAVTAVLTAKMGAAEYPAPLRERIQIRADTLNDQAISQIDAAKKLKDAAAKAKEMARIAAEFDGLPAATAAKDAAK